MVCGCVQAAFYTKWLRDIADSQSYNNATQGTNGAVADCIPWYNHGSSVGDPAWAQAYPLITAWVAMYYSDLRLVERHYDNIKFFIDYEVNRAAQEGGLLTYA